eukprot:1160189-Pelagomonas_calceolata.AAC.1
MLFAIVPLHHGEVSSRKAGLHNHKFCCSPLSKTCEQVGMEGKGEAVIQGARVLALESEVHVSDANA